jgi:iron complex outermembrane receptor protein
MLQMLHARLFGVRKKSRHRGLLLIPVMASLALVATPGVYAADTADDRFIEEILVTARNVGEESLQDTPVAVTALGEETLDIFRIDEATDLLSRIPALNVSIGGSGAGAQITLRGIGSSFISNAFDSAVALNYDGVSVSTQRLLQSAFFDVDQIAVLKGPQSLYFGKAASAGVMALRSANPTEEFEASIKTSYEFEEDGTTIGGYVSGPVTETLGYRLAAEYQTIDKFVEIADGNPTADPDRGLDNLIARGTLLWEPSDRFSANFKLDYNRQRSEILNNAIDIFCGGDGLPDPSVLLGGAFGGTPGIDLFLPTHDCDINDGRFTGPDANPLIDTVPPGSPGEGRNIFRAYNDTDILFARMQLDFQLNESLDLTVLTGYVDLENEYNDTFNSTGQNPDGSAAGLSAPFENTLEQFTMELRLISNLDGPVNFQLGAFWEDRDIGHKTSQNAFNPSLLGVFGPPFGPDPVTGATFDWLADRPIEAEALSFFVSTDIQLSDKWELTGGVRWTDEEKSTSVGFPFVHAGVVAIFGTVSSGFQSPDIKFEDDNISPEVVLRYSFNDNVSIYGAYKTGFKSGGVDNNTLPTGSVVGLIDPDPAVAAASAELLRFESEESEGGEIGLRSQFLDRTVTMNLTGYRYVYENQQVQLFDPGVFAFRTFNAGEVTTQGLELDFYWTTSIPGLSVSGSWAYLDAEITGDFFPSGTDGVGENLKGRDAGFAPELSGNIAINWETSLGDGLRLRISPNLAYKSEYFVGAGSEFNAVTNPTGALVQDSFTTLDLNISIFSPDEKWRLSLIGKNLGDEQILTFAGPAPFRPPTGDDQLVGISRGEQIFLEAAFRF